MTNHTIDRHIRELAQSQHGVVGRWQLRKRGLSSSAVWRRVENGSLMSESKRVLRITGSPITDRSMLMAAVLDSGPGAAVSHRSAAAMWGLPGVELAPIDITGDRPRVCHGDHELAVVHQPLLLLPEHVTELDHVPVTTPSRLLFDLAGLSDIHPKRLERVLDTSWARNLVCHASMTYMVDCLARRGRTGSTLMRELMAERPADYQPPGSASEARFEEIARGVGMWNFERQVNLGDDGRWIGRVDFIDRKRRLVVEVDSALFHGSLTDRRADEARHQALSGAGFVVWSVRSDDLFHRRPMVEQGLREMEREAA